MVRSGILYFVKEKVANPAVVENFKLLDSERIISIEQVDTSPAEEEVPLLAIPPPSLF